VLLLHATDHLLARHAAGEFVSLRQQHTLAGDFRDLAGERVVVEQAGDHLFRGQPLGDGQPVLYHLAFDHGVDDVADAGMFLEAVLAVLQIAARLECDHAAKKHPRLIDHALLHQQVGNLPGAEAARDIDHLVPGEGARRVIALLANKQHGADADREQHERGEEGIADDDRWMAHAPGAACRQRYALRLKCGARAARGMRFGGGDGRRRNVPRRRTGTGAVPALRRRVGGTLVALRRRLGARTLAVAVLRWIGIHAPVPALAVVPLTRPSYRLRTTRAGNDMKISAAPAR